MPIRDIFFGKYRRPSVSSYERDRLSNNVITNGPFEDELENIHRVVKETLENYNYRFNTKETRYKIVNGIICNYLQYCSFQYKIVCDETNNPPDILDMNILHLDIFIKYQSVTHHMSFEINNNRIKSKRIFNEIDPYGEEDWEE